MVESKEVSYAYCTAARVLSNTPCELIYVNVEPSAAALTLDVYDGADTGGDKIIGFDCAVKTNLSFKPPVPIYCKKGLYVGGFANVTGVLVMWRNL